MAHKRSQNEGSVYFYKRLNKWAAQITIEGKRKSKYFDKKGDALKWLREMQNQIDQGLTLKGLDLTLAEFLDRWLEMKKGTVKENTLYDYRNYINRDILPLLGNLKVAEVAPDHVQQLISAKHQQGLATASVLRIFRILNAAFKYAVRLGIIPRNPADVVDRPRQRRKEMKVWDETQVISFISSIEGTRWEALFYVAVTTGLRRGEILGLKWTDLDWVSRNLTIQRQVTTVAGKGLQFHPPKSAAGRRVVVLGERDIEKLQKHVHLQEQMKAFAGDRWQEHGLIFPSTKGTILSPWNVYKAFKELSKKAGLPEIRLHDLRHTAATLMLKQGVHPKIVQERLGHSDIALTLNTYSHVLPTLQNEAAAKLDELLTPIEYKDVVSVGNLGGAS